MEIMKRSLFLKCINAAILFGLVAPTAQAFSATNQNGLRKRAIEYARSTGVDFGKGIRSAYRGTASGLKRVGAGLALGREKAITRAKKEQEHVMEGAKAALKRMKGKKLTKKEQDHLYSFEKRTGALLALLAIIAGATWILTRPTDDGDAPLPAPPAPMPVPEVQEVRLAEPAELAVVREIERIPGPQRAELIQRPADIPAAPPARPRIPRTISAEARREGAERRRREEEARPETELQRKMRERRERQEAEAREKEVERILQPAPEVREVRLAKPAEAAILREVEVIPGPQEAKVRELPAPGESPEDFKARVREKELRKKVEADIEAEMEKLRKEREAPAAPPPPPPAAPGPPARRAPRREPLAPPAEEPRAFLEELQAGRQLRRVEPAARPKPAGEGGLAGVVAADPKAAAMLEQKRRQAEEAEQAKAQLALTRSEIGRGRAWEEEAEEEEAERQRQAALAAEAEPAAPLSAETGDGDSDGDSPPLGTPLVSPSPEKEEGEEKQRQRLALGASRLELLTGRRKALEESEEGEEEEEEF